MSAKLSEYIKDEISY